MAGGRPTAFRPEYVQQVRQLCLLGATNNDLAAFFKVSTQTVDAWTKAHPEFLEALNDGKRSADEKVAQRLYQRALGYSHKAVKIMQYEGDPVKVDYVEHYPPDTTAAIFWLKNRRPDLWRDTVEKNVVHSGVVTHEHSAVSETAEWLTGMLGASADKPPPKPLQN